jgi:hypothetical protein
MRRMLLSSGCAGRSCEWTRGFKVMFRWWFLPLEVQRFGAAVCGNGYGSGVV